jgi:hypothetical protein
MKRTFAMVILLALALLPVVADATPVSGIFNSTDMGGVLLTGRASTWRPGINSGLPHVLHLQSWNGTTLGTQWDVSCSTENTAFNVVDNRVGGNGTIVYTSVFSGGTFTFTAGGWPWGDGTGTLNNSTLITTVQYVMIGGNSTPVASVVNGNTTGLFSNGCLLSFVIANGSGVGETNSATPTVTKPATFPAFLDGTCGLASAGQQFGTWGNVITITMGIDCSVPVENSTWTQVKASYR